MWSSLSLPSVKLVAVELDHVISKVPLAHKFCELVLPKTYISQEKCSQFYQLFSVPHFSVTSQAGGPPGEPLFLSVLLKELDPRC